MKHLSRFIITSLIALTVSGLLTQWPTSPGVSLVKDKVRIIQKSNNTFKVNLTVNDEMPNRAHRSKSDKADQRLLDFCEMRFVGRFTKSLDDMLLRFDDYEVSPATKATKQRPLWDVMSTTCDPRNSASINLSNALNKQAAKVCAFIDWRVPLGVDGDVQRLMLQAQAQLRIPEPSVGLPLFDRAGGKVGVLVRAASWFWTDADTYRAWSKRVEVDGHWAEVTAMPISLEFTPRPGEQPVKCEGPGEVFVPGRDSNAVDAPSGCFYRYRYTTINDPDMTKTASLGVRWQISWKGSNGKGADIAQIVTSTDQPLQVFEAQTLVTQ